MSSHTQLPLSTIHICTSWHRFKAPVFSSLIEWNSLSTIPSGWKMDGRYIVLCVRNRFVTLSNAWSLTEHLTFCAVLQDQLCHWGSPQMPPHLGWRPSLGWSLWQAWKCGRSWQQGDILERFSLCTWMLWMVPLIGSFCLFLSVTHQWISSFHSGHVINVSC